MAVSPFVVSAAGSFASQPSASGERLIFRSSAAADVSPLTLTAVGEVSSTPSSESIDFSALTLGGQIEQQTTAAFETLTLIKTDAAPTGIVSVYGQGTKGNGYIIVNTLPLNNTTLTIGLTGFTQVYTFKTTLTGAANEILIGADKYICASNIFEAINNGTVADANNGTNAGTNYGTGTVRNAYVSAYSTSAFSTADLNRTSQTTIYLRDRLAVVRQLTWSISTTAADFAISSITGAATGTLLAQLTSTLTQITVAMSFYNPGLSAVLGTGLLLGGTTPTTDWYYNGGKLSTVRLYCSNVSSGIVLDIEGSDDGTNPYSLGLTIASLDNNDQYFGLWPVEYMRLKFTSNANTADTPIHCVVTAP